MYKTTVIHQNVKMHYYIIEYYWISNLLKWFQLYSSAYSSACINSSSLLEINTISISKYYIDRSDAMNSGFFYAGQTQDLNRAYDTCVHSGNIHCRQTHVSCHDTQQSQLTCAGLELITILNSSDQKFHNLYSWW